MSLSSFLLGSGATKASASKTIDNDLDALFKSTKTAAPPPAPRPLAATNSEKKRKSHPIADEDGELKKDEVKRKKSTKEDSDVKSSREDKKSKEEKTKTEKAEKGGRERRAKKIRLDDSEDEEDENDAGLEDAYAKGRVVKLAEKEKKLKAEKKTKNVEKEKVGSDEEMKDADADRSSESEAEEDASQLVHESLSGSKSRKDRRDKRTKKEKFVPEDETAEQRNERTIFVGNVAVEVAKSKSALKSFKRHILSHLPSSISSTAKIESTRIRSVAFSLPTSKLDPSTSTSDPSKTSRTDLSKTSTDAALKSNHERDRAASWRASRHTKDDEDDEKEREKKSKLTSQEKKRVAFIKRDIHESADSVNVYVVFAHSRPHHSPSSERSDEGTSAATVVAGSEAARTSSPYEIATLAVQHCNATVFMDRTIRVDRVSTTSGTANSSNNVVTARPNGVDGVGADPKKTIFVGNLDFASKEEDLRVYFEGVVSGERGPRGTGSDDEAEEGEEDETEEEEGEDDDEGKDKEKKNEKAKRWVTSVRIVRDRDTQLGKGFAYVQFADRECVDEILALSTNEENKLKFAKRKLRVQRCKTIPGVKLSSTNARAQIRAAAATSNPRTSTNTNTNSRTPNSNTKSFARGSNATPTGTRPTKHREPIIVPKGDPSLGTKLAHLPKEARKEVKAHDVDRVARRLAKKKARGQMDSQLRKGKIGGDGEVKVRIRERVKSGAKAGARGAKSKGGGGKTRMRSEKSLMKRNEKK